MKLLAMVVAIMIPIPGQRLENIPGNRLGNSEENAITGPSERLAVVNAPLFISRPYLKFLSYARRQEAGKKILSDSC